MGVALLFFYVEETLGARAAGFVDHYERSGRESVLVIDAGNQSGHLIGPFEVESALLELEEVAESGVIGAPDDLLFEKVVAFVHLHSGYEPSTELEIKLRLYISNKVSSIATPQELLFVEKVPKNKSGKIMRRVLKARYLGQDEGDISTLED